MTDLRTVPLVETRSVVLEDVLTARFGASVARILLNVGPLKALALLWFGRKFDRIVLAFATPGMKWILLLFGALGLRKIVVFELIYHQDRKPALHRAAYVVLRVLLLRPAMRRCVAAAQVMTGWERDFYARWYGIDEARLQFVPWPLMSIAGAEARSSQAATEASVLASGRAACDWETLIAGAEGQNWRLTIVCGRADYPRVRALAEGTTIRLLTEIPTALHTELLRATTVYVLCLYEASASAGQVRLAQCVQLGVPLVASDVRGLDGYLVDGVTGVSVPPGDPLALRAAINRLLGSQDLREEMTRKALQRAAGDTLEKYIARCFDQVVGFGNEAARDNPRPAPAPCAAAPRLAPGESARTAGRTREATATDAPEIARMFMKVFRNRPDRAPQALIDDILSIFIHHPDARPGMGSLVYERADGSLAGFFGIVPTPAIFDGRKVFAAAVSTLMVEDVEREPRVAVALARSHFSRPFDCHYGDTANSKSVTLLSNLHMRLSPSHSLRWSFPLNFAGLLGLAAARRIGWTSRAPVGALAEVERAIRALIGRRAATIASGWTILALTPADFASLYLAFLQRSRFHPDWSVERVVWMLGLAGRRPQLGPLRLVSIRNASGRAVGLAAYHAETNGRAEIVALQARKRDYASCIIALAADALERKCVILSGKTDPETIHALICLPRVYCHAGPGAGVKADDEELVRAVLGGDGALGGLVGDNWTPLASETYF